MVQEGIRSNSRAKEYSQYKDSDKYVEESSMKKVLPVILAIIAVVFGVLYFTTNKNLSEQINSLNAQIAEKNTEIEVLTADLAGKTAEADSLMQEVSEKTNEIDALNVQVAAQSEKLVSREQQIEGLVREVSLKGAEVIALNRTIEERDLMIEEIEKANSETIEQIEGLVNDFMLGITELIGDSTSAAIE